MQACRVASRRHFGFNDIEQILMSVDIELRVDVFDMRLHRVARNRELFLNIKLSRPRASISNTSLSRGVKRGSVGNGRACLLECRARRLFDTGRLRVDDFGHTVDGINETEILQTNKRICREPKNERARCQLHGDRVRQRRRIRPYANCRTGDAAKRRHAAPPCNGRNRRTRIARANRGEHHPANHVKQRVAAREKRRARRIRPWSRNRCCEKNRQARKAPIPAQAGRPFTNLPDEATVYKAKKPIGTIEKKSAKGAPSTSPKRSEKPNATRKRNRHTNN